METDPSLRDREPGAAFADVWHAIPKVVFSRTLTTVQGDARLAEDAAAAVDATQKDASIGGAGPAASAVELGLVDELRMCRHPVVVGGGTPFLPPVADPRRTARRVGTEDPPRRSPSQSAGVAAIGRRHAPPGS